jgi:hypothetical protein
MTYPAALSLSSYRTLRPVDSSLRARCKLAVSSHLRHARIVLFINIIRSMHVICPIIIISYAYRMHTVTVLYVQRPFPNAYPHDMLMICLWYDCYEV